MKKKYKIKKQTSKKLFCQRIKTVKKTDNVSLFRITRAASHELESHDTDHYFITKQIIIFYRFTTRIDMLDLFLLLISKTKCFKNR